MAPPYFSDSGEMDPESPDLHTGSVADHVREPAPPSRIGLGPEPKPTASPSPGAAPTLTPGEAQQRADAIVAAAVADPMHPLNDPTHPGHADTVAEFERLNGLAARGSTTAGALPMPELPGQEPADQPVVTGATNQAPDPAGYVEREAAGITADKPTQDVVRAIGEEFGSAQPERELLERAADLVARDAPAVSEVELATQLEAAWPGSDFDRNHDKINRVFEWAEARLATAAPAIREQIMQQLDRLNSNLEGCEAIVRYYDARWARGNDAFTNFHAGLESAKQQAEDRARAAAAKAAETDQAPADFIVSDGGRP